eukprot:GHUV01034187.1.p2 GENE.GHUV01034187.1~~GHUV01034187.1.p2  ORF type:complete len:110 (+),score=19.04 GHUV01034187.1:117-446(+)
MQTAPSALTAEMAITTFTATQRMSIAVRCVTSCRSRPPRGGLSRPASAAAAWHAKLQQMPVSRHVCRSLFDDKIEAEPPQSPHPSLVNEGVRLFLRLVLRNRTDLALSQ